MMYLRGFLTLLVLFHHASLAYFPLRPPAALSLVHSSRWWGAFPVVDKVQWKGFLFTVVFNDIYTMTLFFLLSGLFTWQSLRHRGISKFLRGRLLRLGIPLVIFSLVSPFSYYPAYLQSRTHDGFWHQWLGLGDWPPGPMWFLGVLFAFDLLIAAVFRLMPGSFERLSRNFGRVQSPVAMAALLLVLSYAAYLPMALRFNRFEGFAWGPFFVHKVRVLIYLLYFLAGVALGAAGLQQGLLQAKGRLEKQWAGWLVAAPSCFLFMEGLVFLSHRFWNPPLWEIAIDFGFCLVCVASTFALLSLSLRFVRREYAILNSLAACAYGIYLVHYSFNNWLQYALLSFSAPAWLKAGIVFSLTVLISWSLVRLLRRVAFIAKVV